MQDCWGLIERATFGYEPEAERHILMKDLDRKEGAERRLAFLQKYYKAVMALPS